MAETNRHRNNENGLTASVRWNPKVQLIISDVDETIADLYVAATTAMIRQLESILAEGKVLFLVSGQSFQSIRWRIADKIHPELRHGIIVGHCSGVEVWGFNKDGEPLEQPFYSLLDSALTTTQQKTWREVIQRLISEFNLDVIPAMPLLDFEKAAGENPLAIMPEDRGPQITFEVVNGYNLTAEQIDRLEIEIPQINGTFDLRTPIIERGAVLLKENGVPITPRLAGVFAVDFVLEGVSKTTAVKYVVDNDSVLRRLGLSKQEIQNPLAVEVWGDKFTLTGGTDRHISEALPKEIRSIDFRRENPTEFPEGYNIVVWDGREQLHEGLLEYLNRRPDPEP